MESPFEIELKQILRAIEEIQQKTDLEGRHDQKESIQLQIKKLQWLKGVVGSYSSSTNESKQYDFIIRSLMKRLRGLKPTKSSLSIPQDLVFDLPDFGPNVEDKQKIKFVVKELYETEQVYINEVDEILKGYYYSTLEHENLVALRKELPPVLLNPVTNEPSPTKVQSVFCNLPEIYSFHSKAFLLQEQRTEHVQSDYPDLCGICQIFMKNHERLLTIYRKYCQLLYQNDKVLSKLMKECEWFLKCQQKLGHRLNLKAYLLKPLQRISKFSLLFMDLLKYTSSNTPEHDMLQKALDSLLIILQCLNDQATGPAIIWNYEPSFVLDGNLLLHSPNFTVTRNPSQWFLSRKASSCDLFMYEKSLLICKRKMQHSGDGQHYLKLKSRLELKDVYLIDRAKKDSFHIKYGKGAYKFKTNEQRVKGVWLKCLERLLLEGELGNMESNFSG